MLICSVYANYAAYGSHPICGHDPTATAWPHSDLRANHRLRSLPFPGVGVPYWGRGHWESEARSRSGVVWPSSGRRRPSLLSGLRPPDSQAWPPFSWLWRLGLQFQREIPEAVTKPRRARPRSLLCCSKIFTIPKIAIFGRNSADSGVRRSV